MILQRTEQDEETSKHKDGKSDKKKRKKKSDKPQDSYKEPSGMRITSAYAARRELSSMSQQLMLVTFETFFLTGMLPIQLGQDSAVKYDILMVALCMFFGSILVLALQCSFYLKIRGSDY